MPRPDRDSGSLDALNLMTMLREADFEVAFSPLDLSYERRYSDALAARGIHLMLAFSGLAELLREVAPAADLAILSRGPVAHRILPLLRAAAPDLPVIFNTVDVQFLRLQRLAELVGDQQQVLFSRQVREAELNLVREADATIVVSDFEQDLLQRELPRAKVHLIPPPRAASAPGNVPLSDRRDIVFIGGFGHPPNGDGILWFAHEIWPLIIAEKFGGRLHIVGSDPPPEVRALASERVSVHGHLPDLDPLFHACRLSIAPLRYGAGVKGKVITSLGYGLPVVATPAALEGSGLKDGVGALEAADPKAFAEAALRLLHDDELWRRVSRQGRRAFDAIYSFGAVRPRFLRLVREVASLRR